MSYLVEVWRGGSCIEFTRVYQRRTVLSAVEHGYADLRADVIFISRGGKPVAQVTSGGFWQWQNAAVSADLHAYVDTSASANGGN